ncbi:MAG: hypothetical protein KGJ82_09775 [Nitrospirota bacterium]|nr:hypothetical protein [Nitrospirota bacterium]
MRWTSRSEGATVTYERNGIIERRAMIRSSATGYRLLNERGNTLAEVEYAADGTLTVLDHDCRIVQRWTDDQLRLFVQGHGPRWANLWRSRLPSRRVLRERMMNELFTLKLGRDKETLADMTELQLLQRAKINSSGMIRFFKRVSEKGERWMECGD